MPVTTIPPATPLSERPTTGEARSGLLSRDSTLMQFVRYLPVGVVSFVADTSVLFALTHLCHIHYLVSTIFGFVVGVAVNYVLSLRLVFTRRSVTNKHVEMMAFLVIGVAGLGLTELFMWTFTDLLHAHLLVSKVITTALVFLWNFGARKVLLFR